MITQSAYRTASANGLCLEDIEDIVASLTTRDFYKSMPAAKRPGVWQDVYKVRFNGLRLYVKLQMPFNVAVLISLKTDESAPP